MPTETWCIYPNDGELPLGSEAATTLVRQIAHASVRLWADGPHLWAQAPKGIITEKRVEVLSRYRGAIVAHLAQQAGDGQQAEEQCA